MTSLLTQPSERHTWRPLTRILQIWAVIAIVLTVTACGAENDDSAAGSTPTPSSIPTTNAGNAPTSTPTEHGPTPTNTVAGTTLTPTSTFGSPDCFFSWTYEELPDLAAEVEESLATAATEATVRVQGSGETKVCFDVVEFIPLEANFELTFTVEDPDDLERLGELTILAYHAIDSATGPPQPQEVNIDFRSGNIFRSLSFTYTDATAAVEGGLSGADLLEALGYPFLD